jgi:hypothetical protein
MSTKYTHNGETTTAYDSWPLIMGLIGWLETSVNITTNRCLITKKSAVLIYFATEAWNHGYLPMFLISMPTYYWHILEIKTVCYSLQRVSLQHTLLIIVRPKLRFGFEISWCFSNQLIKTKFSYTQAMTGKNVNHFINVLFRSQHFQELFLLCRNIYWLPEGWRNDEFN